MSAEITNTGIICPKKELDIVRTLTCGQMFRYFQQSNGSFKIMSGDKYCELYYSGDKTVIKTDDPDYFYGYFDFATDYDKIIAELSAFDELHNPLTVSRGLRILRQDRFETAVQFIISANNNIKRIRGIVERICEKCGTRLKNGFYAFPERERLLALTAEDYRNLGCGFRDEYLYKSVPMLTDEYLGYVAELPHDKAKRELCKLSGVGPKVAECILLFAYKMTDSYPVDTWIFKAGKTAELDTPQKVSDFYSARYGKNAGYAQQYIFEYIRNSHGGENGYGESRI